MDDFGVREHKWLKFLYNTRAKWYITLSKDVFFTGIQSSQYSESTNNVLNGITRKPLVLPNICLHLKTW